MIRELHFCRGVIHSPKSVLSMTLDCIYWWGSNSKVLWSAGYPFIAINVFHSNFEWEYLFYCLNLSKLFLFRIVTWNYNCVLRIIVKILETVGKLLLFDWNSSNHLFAKKRWIESHWKGKIKKMQFNFENSYNESNFDNR